MASVDIKITNLKEIKKAFDSSPIKMARELDKAIKKSLISIQAETILNVGGQRGIKVITHGLASAAENGKALTFKPLQGTYFVNILYAPFVHDGTKFMKARPFLKKAVDTKQETVQKYFTEAVDNVLSQIGKET